jgi:hypothetical protein
MTIDNDRLVQRYSHLNPTVNANGLRALLSYEPTNFRWAGADLFYVTDKHG